MLRLSGQVPGGSLAVMDGQIGAAEHICGANLSVIINYILK